MADAGKFNQPRARPAFLHFLGGFLQQQIGFGAAYRKRPREESRRDFRKVVETGPPRGLLAFDAAVSLSASGTGYASTFARLGFMEVARRAAARPIMRHDLKTLSPQGEGESYPALENVWR